MFEAGARFAGIGRFTLGYREGDARNATVIPVSTTGGAAGAPYTDNGPSGSTGVGGNVGLSVDSEVRLQDYYASTELFLDDEPDLLGAASPGRAIDEMMMAQIAVRPFLMVAAEYRDRDHRGSVAITTPVLFSQTLDQSVNELEISVAVGAEAVIPLGTGARFTLGGELGAYLYDFELSSLETVSQNFGPASDRDFTTEIEDGESGIGYTGAIRAEFIIDLSGRPIDGQHRGGVELFAGGGGRFLSDRAQVVNPFSGDFVLAGGTTFLDTDHAFDWRVFAGLRYTFGQPPQPGRAR
jgi:hypothetical protein